MNKIESLYFSEDYIETFNNLKSGILARLNKLIITGSTKSSVQELNTKKNQLEDYFRNLENGNVLLKTEVQVEKELKALSDLFGKYNEEQPNRSTGITM